MKNISVLSFPLIQRWRFWRKRALSAFDRDICIVLNISAFDCRPRLGRIGRIEMIKYNYKYHDFSELRRRDSIG